MANPKDATLRNVKSGNKRDDKHDAKLKELQRRVKQLEKAVNDHLGLSLK